MVQERGGKIAEPDEVTDATLDLSSDTADFATGSPVGGDGRMGR